jgi:nickel-type superoxide dismutase maturation protease
MLPALRPGDRIVVWRGARIEAGQVVVARHPRQPDLLIVKRALRREDGGWWLESDNQAAPGRQDSWDFGPVAVDLVLARAMARYWPHPAMLRRQPSLNG